MSLWDDIKNVFLGPQASIDPEPLFTLSIREKTPADRIKKEPEFSHLYDFIPDEVEAHELNFREFTQMFAASCRNAVARANITIQEEGLVLVGLESGGIFTCNLTNIWMNCGQSPGFRKEQISFFLANILAVEDIPDAIDLNKVIPVIRNFDFPLNLNSNERDTAIGASVASGLDILMALDMDFGVQIVSVSQFETSKISLEDLMERALKNLVEIVLPPQVQVYQGIDCSWSLSCNHSSLNSSIILVDEVMNFIQKEADGKLAFAVPSRDALLCCRANSEEEMKRLSKFLLRNRAKFSHSISSNIFSYDRGAIRVLVNNDSK